MKDYFHLVSDANNKQLPVTIAVRFKYPNRQRRAMRSKWQYASGQRLALINKASKAANYHYNYSFSGARSNVPMHVFDDGRFTYFQFRSHQNIPAIFAIHNANAKESVVDYRMHGNTVIVLQVAPQFSLRNNNQVSSIFNNDLVRKIKRRK